MSKGKRNAAASKANCVSQRSRFSASLDGTMSGREMQQLEAHTRSCRECGVELQQWQQMQQVLASLGPRQAPADMGLRLRVAISQARASSANRWVDRLELSWQNTMRPLLLQCSAGLVTAVAVLAFVGVLVGVVAAPERVQASSVRHPELDEPLGMATAPHFQYSMLPNVALKTAVETAVVVEVFVDAEGRVYDYKVVAGEDTEAVRQQLNNVLYFSVFTPATVFGRPVAGHAVMSFAGIAVHG